MILTVDAVRALKEDDLSRDVLVPLFRAMKYQDVRFHGGGILEQGKDLTMWRQHGLRGRTNCAGVVKAVPITGEAITAMVVSQLRQAFAVPFQDVGTGSPMTVHECFVITSQRMKKEAVFTFRNVIDAEPFARYVTVVDGFELWTLISQHLGVRATLGELIESLRRLSEATEYALSVSVDSSSTKLTFRSKDGRPIAVRTPAFPDTADGHLNRAAYEQFLKTGEPAELKLNAIEGLPGADLISELGVASDDAVLNLRRTIRPLVGELRCRAKGGEVLSIPGLVFEATGGSDQLKISNHGQASPLRFSFTVLFDPKMPGGGTATFEMNASCSGRSIYWYVLYIEYLSMASKGCIVSFKDTETGIEHNFGFLRWTGTMPTSDHVKVARRVLRLQELTKHPILVPDRPFFTPEDIEGIDFVETAIKTGRQTAESMQFDLTPTTHSEDDWRKKLTEPVKNLKVETDSLARLVLDTYVPLGPMEVTCRSGIMGTPDVEKAIKTLAAGQPVEVSVMPSPGSQITVVYPAWRRKRR